ncbi:spore germination protein [Caldisalinibacter kiritimatiensis]|uniref:Spore germination protein GerKA n=1 Tax=Caldisalinibacter kiritimatiensis TaxID=1304284 RepID=R1CSV1_9FIRM|nr:spore germination protein [Caldisalinibacter kiritimatiensis]EOC99783.1 Spore germination protein GerKA [Caldisalinibacter kiritimatiensis]
MFNRFKNIISDLKHNVSNEDKMKTAKKVNIEENIKRRLKHNLKLFRSIFHDCSDVVFKEFKIGSEREINAAIIYVDGLIDREIIHTEILKPLMYLTRLDEYNSTNISIEFLKNTDLAIGEIKEKKKLEEIVALILSGETALLIDGIDKALLLNSRGWENRQIEEPQSESVSRGPKDGFTETLRFNTALIRRKIKHPDLKVKMMNIGERTNTDVAIVYMEEIAKKEVVEEVLSRLKTIKIDGIFESGYIEEFIEDNPYSPFPQVEITERTDKASAALLEGRVAIIVDGTPVVSLVPAIMVNFYQTPEDYYEKPLFASALRLLRVLGFLVATSLPSLYVAFLSFHFQLIPIKLVETLAEGRVKVPFPPFVEALLMEILIDLLREANLRLPGTLGQSIGVVGAIVIGQAAVSANLASPAMVIIVSITAIGAYVIPRFSTSYSIRFLRYPMIFFAATLGIFGIAVVWLWILIHLCALESFGNPYLSPFTPLKIRDLKDTVIRAPLWAMRKRPTSPDSEDKNRQDLQKGRINK